MSFKSCEHGRWPLGAQCLICGPNGHYQAKSNQKDAINPDHYKVGGIETIDYLEAKMTPEQFEGFCVGNALKYISRAGHKNDAAEDYRKAIWYLERIIRQ